MDIFLSEDEKKKLKSLNPKYYVRDHFIDEYVNIYHVLPEEVAKLTAGYLWDQAHNVPLKTVDYPHKEFKNAHEYNEFQRQQEKEQQRLFPVAVTIPEKLEAEESVTVKYHDTPQEQEMVFTKTPVDSMCIE